MPWKANPCSTHTRLFLRVGRKRNTHHTLTDSVLGDHHMGVGPAVAQPLHKASENPPADVPPSGEQPASKSSIIQ